MDFKENGMDSSSFTVKPEPKDHCVPNPQPFTPTLNQDQKPNMSAGVKLEQTDSKERVQLDSSLPPQAPPELGPVLKTYQSAEDIEYTPEAAMEHGRGMVTTLAKTISKLELGAMRKDVWDKTVKDLLAQTSPKTLIAVCGATGAGKSSILNAVLDDNIVPTSGMRACTATVTEISYHDKNTIDADISFLGLEEWRQELKVLLDDLVDSEEGTLRRATDLKSDAGIAWSKVNAVYPTLTPEALVTMTADQILDYSPYIKSILGTTKKIVAKNSSIFATEIAKYIDSKDQSRGKDKNRKDTNGNKKQKTTHEEPQAQAQPQTVAERIMAAARKEARQEKDKKDKKPTKAANNPDAPALWPLIRLVNVHCNAKALSTGAILVDLPGVADANAARNNIAKDYMKRCQCIWILAPIMRAVDDKTAKDLLGDAFKLQLMSAGYVESSYPGYYANQFASPTKDGNYDDHTITFIASKCDDISCSEVIHSLHLEDDEDLERIEADISDSQENKQVAKKARAVIEEELDGIAKALRSEKAINKEYKEHLEALKKGEPFTRVLTAKGGAGKKGKNSGKGKGKRGKKRARSDSEDDDSSDSESESSESESESDNDDDNDASNSEANDSGDDSDGEGEEEEEPETPETLKVKIATSKESAKGLRARQTELKAARDDLKKQIGDLEKAEKGLQRRKNAFCSLKRSEFSRDVLKEDFRTGLKELDDRMTNERDPDGFDPNVDLRDYDKINLPVFTCSSRDYVRLQGQVRGDGEATCFSNIEDTGIPDLQQWCRQLTLASREKLTRMFFNSISAFVNTLLNYVAGIQGVTVGDREALRAKWDSGHNDDDVKQMDLDDDPFADIPSLSGMGLYSMPGKTKTVSEDHGITNRLVKDFTEAVANCTDDLKRKFQDGLEEKCRAGAAKAAGSAVETSDTVANTGHWASYRALLRRHGVWRRDLNEELLLPFTQSIATSWGKLFQDNLLRSFQAAIEGAIDRLLEDFEASAAVGLKDQARIQALACKEDANAAMQKSIVIVAQSLTEQQKEISRSLSPYVQNQLIPAYDRAMEERGPGSVARQKAYFHSFVDANKNNIFSDGADVIMDGLEDAAESVRNALCASVGELANRIEVCLSVLWENTSVESSQVRARGVLVEEANKIAKQIDLWRQAEQLKRDNQRVAEELTGSIDVEMAT